MLEKKYDWRRWMVLVYDASPPANSRKTHKIAYCDGFAKYEYHGKNIVVASNRYDMGMMPGHQMRWTFERIPVKQYRCKDLVLPDMPLHPNRVCTNVELTAQEIFNSLPTYMKEIDCDPESDSPKSSGVVRKSLHPAYKSKESGQWKFLTTVSLGHVVMHVFA